MNPKNPDHPTPDNSDNSDNSAWEEAMSRDFDARVRDLHEAPLDFDSVKGKAHTIKRNRRAAVAGGILGVAAIVTPIAVLTNSADDTGSRVPDFAEQTTDTAAPPAAPDYLQGRTWHQADGDAIELDQEYGEAVQWGERLVAIRSSIEVFSTADVIDEDGDVAYSFDVAGGVVVNDEGTTIAWVGTDGAVNTQGDGDPEALGSVDLAAPGEAIAWSAAAITGGPTCSVDDAGCVVYLNSSLGEAPRSFGASGLNEVVADALLVFDSTADGAVSIITEIDDFGDTCGGIYDDADRTVRWRTCTYQVQQFSPNGDYFVGTQSQYDGTGPSRIAIVDAADGTTEAGSFERDGWFVGDWTWSPEGALVFTAFEGGRWHLMTMTVGGDVTELADPVRGDEFTTAFRLIHR